MFVAIIIIMVFQIWSTMLLYTISKYMGGKMHEDIWKHRPFADLWGIEVPREYQRAPGKGGEK